MKTKYVVHWHEDKQKKKCIACKRALKAGFNHTCQSVAYQIDLIASFVAS